MKKFLAIMMALVCMISACSCSHDIDEDFHFDLIQKYQNVNGETFYKDVLGDVEILDYGVRYNAALYDVENTHENELTYYYKYEGEKEKAKGLADMRNYVEYLAETFDGDINSDVWQFKTDNGDNIMVTYFNMTINAVGLMVAVVVPTKDVKASEKVNNVTYMSDTASTEVSSEG